MNALVRKLTGVEPALGSHVISFVPSTPFGFGLFLLILVLGPKRGLWVLFLAMPFGATAVFSASGIGNVVLLDFCAVAYVLATSLRMYFDEFAGAVWYGRPGFALFQLCVIAILGAYFLPRVFAGQIQVFSIQTLDGRRFIELAYLMPSGAQAAQLARLLLGAAVFFALTTVPWHRQDWYQMARAVIVASCAHVLVSLVDWISFPLGLAHLLDPLRTIFQAILVDQHFGSVRRIIGGHTEPASFGIYTIGLFAFWLRVWFGKTQIPGAGWFLLAMVVLALRSTSSATIANLLVFSSLIVLWHWRQLASNQTWVTTYVAVLAVLPVIVMGSLALFEYSAAAQSLADALFLDKFGSTSGKERFSWNRQAVANFIESYGLGLGIGSVRASGWGFAVLGNLGLPGALAFGWFLVGALRRRPPVIGPGDPAMDVAGGLRCACLAVLLQSVLTTPYPNLGLPFFTMCGLAVALDQASRNMQVRVAPSMHSAQWSR